MHLRCLACLWRWADFSARRSRSAFSASARRVSGSIAFLAIIRARSAKSQPRLRLYQVHYFTPNKPETLMRTPKTSWWRWRGSLKSQSRFSSCDSTLLLIENYIMRSIQKCDASIFNHGVFKWVASWLHFYFCLNAFYKCLKRTERVCLLKV